MKVPASLVDAASTVSGAGKGKAGRKSTSVAQPKVIKRAKIECLDVSSDSE